ncbi:CAP-Gly domain-containing linker protein 4-like isoform X2 [Lethenteron reissneri]|uniref:CAP-Gly domain-containing linker protein 4-like isoform X2 n=1 Tax=Lethenteron reissneri TaxID=7753 RepID=UPI002AB6C476|nr:CAP-Gly domain-containing linker protein 4-like isoform X2 [Lethenteron reissneri]
MTREEDVEPALEVEFGMLDYKSSIDSTEGIVSRVHAVATAPMPPGSDFAFFDPKEPSCQTLLLSPSTTVSQLFAVLRQWVPQVQQHVALIGNEMLKRGCHPNDRDELTDMTLLHYTCKAGAPGIGDAEAAAAFAGRLLTLGANPSLRSRWTGMNALHYAAYFDVPELIPVVLQAVGPKEVDATCSDFDFGTALHIAASNLCLSAAKSLLEHSANPLFKNNRGLVPCDVVPDAADMPLEMAEVALVAREIRRLLSRATASPALLPTPPLPSQPPAPPGLTVGQRVIVGGRKTGVLRFCGPTEFAGGQWAGVELDEADGKNNGSVDGTRYFTCAPRHGIFAPLSKVARAEESSRRGSLNSSGAIRGAAPVLRIAARGPHADPCHDDAASRRTAGHTNMKTLSGPRRKAQASAFSSDASAENNSNTPQGSGSSSSGSSSPHLTRRRASVTLPLKPSRNAGGAQPPRTKPAESRIQHGVRKRLPSSGSGGTSDGAAELELGERLLVSGQRAGVLRFQGTTHFAPGHWYGIELEQPSGRNDGSVAGVRYFQCPAKHGVFAPPSRVQRLTVSMESLLDLPTGKASHPLSAFQRSLSIPNTGKPPRKPLGRTPMNSRGKPGSLCRSLSHTAALAATNDAVSPATSSPAAAVPGGSDRANLEKVGGGGGRCGAPRLRDGMQVLVAGTGEMGTVRFVGEVGFAAGTWLGLELRAPRGKHDGAVGGQRYFSCRPGCGIMVRPGRVSYRGINGARLLGEALLG